MIKKLKVKEQLGRYTIEADNVTIVFELETLVHTPFLCFMNHLQMVCKDINSRQLDSAYIYIYI